jgi:hypothetical protein
MLGMDVREECGGGGHTSPNYTSSPAGIPTPERTTRRKEKENKAKFGKGPIIAAIGTKEVVCQPASQANRGGRSPGWVSSNPPPPLAKQGTGLNHMVPRQRSSKQQLLPMCLVGRGEGGSVVRDLVIPSSVLGRTVLCSVVL